MSNNPPSSTPTIKGRKRAALRKLLGGPTSGRSSPNQIATSTNASTSASSADAIQVNAQSVGGKSTSANQVASVNTFGSGQLYSTHTQTLWDQAILEVELPLALRNDIDFASSNRLTILESVGDAAVKSQQKCTSEHWKFTWNGKEVVLRELAGKLIDLINKFAAIGDLAIQYNPTPAALPWAGFRLLLQFALADAENMGHVLVGLEKTAQCIHRCAIYESLYAGGQRVSDATDDHKRTIVALYVAILTFQATAITFYNKNGFVRGAKAVFDTKALQEQISAIEEKENSVRNSMRLVDVEDQKEFNVNLSDNQKELKALLVGLDSTFGTELLVITSELTSIKSFQQTAKELRQSAEQDRHLATLPQAQGASFNSYQNQSRTECLEDTRKDLLLQIEHWRDKPDAPALFWLSGMAGTGKSTIAKTVAQTSLRQHFLGASFFFTRDAGDLSNARKFFTTLAFQLSNRIPALKPYISRAIAKDSNILSANFRDQWKSLICEPLNQLPHQQIPPRIILVIDALDECESEDDIRCILGLLINTKSIKTVQIRVFITSRPELPIRGEFKKFTEREHQDLVLHEIEHSIIHHDIILYFKHEFGKIQAECSNLPQGWPGQNTIETLAQLAEQLFIYAATVCRFVGDQKWSPKERLDLILQESNAANLLRRSSMICILLSWKILFSEPAIQQRRML